MPGAGPSHRPGRGRSAAIIRPVTPLLVGAAGLVALVVGGMVLRTFGAEYRIGRLLATARAVSIAEANALAAAGRREYVRVAGRIDATDEFEDEHHRPLVFRRVRLETQAGGSWRSFEDHRQSVPFAINEGLDSIGIDVDALAAGLIVVPRESVGRAADLPDRAPEGIAPDTVVRVRIDQLSSVEHATVVGYPVASGTTEPAPAAHLTSGRGRPLILTPLETPEAMRILAGGDAGRTRLAAALLGAGAMLIAGAVLWAAITAVLPAVIAVVPGADHLVSAARAASIDPSAPAVGGDPRSNGQGPGLVGAPGLAILGVLALGIAAAIATTAYVRVTRPRGESDPARSTRPRR